MADKLSFTIERATDADAEPVAALSALVAGDDRFRQYFIRTVHAGDCIVARIQSAIIGYAVADTSFYENCFVWMLAVHPAYRRQGVGSSLMRYIEARCPTEKLFTSTNRSNAPMHELCASLGYVRSGVIDNLDEGDPEIVYFKRVTGKLLE